MSAAPDLQLRLPDAAATAALGAALAGALAGRPGLLVYLRGQLGAGKTTLVRGWLQALGMAGPVRSPTYTLVEPYQTAAGNVLHLDLYRLGHPAEIEQLGLADTPPERNLWLVEWPEQAGGRLPPADLEIELRPDGAGRLAVLRPAFGLVPALRQAAAALGAAAGPQQDAKGV